MESTEYGRRRGRNAELQRLVVWLARGTGRVVGCLERWLRRSDSRSGDDGMAAVRLTFGSRRILERVEFALT